MSCELSNTVLNKNVRIHMILISKFYLLSFQTAGTIVERCLKCIWNWLNCCRRCYCKTHVYSKTLRLLKGRWTELVKMKVTWMQRSILFPHKYRVKYRLLNVRAQSITLFVVKTNISIITLCQIKSQKKYYCTQKASLSIMQGFADVVITWFS